MTINNPTPSQEPQLWALWREAFGDSEEFLNQFIATAYRSDRCLCAVEDGKVVSAAYWFHCTHDGQPVAYLYAVATAQSHRGRGIAHSLMQALHAHLEKLGYQGAILVPGDDLLFSLYETMGYHTCSSVREFVCAGAAEEVQLRRLEPAEYAILRREMLPQGSVLQEESNLDFLAAQAVFYAGPNFLLAAAKQGTTLVGIELLGDYLAAPAIVQALGFAHGSFRTPGSERPFAMYRPLGASTLPAPAYFGFAFD